MHLRRIEHPSVWSARDLREEGAWRVELTRAEQQEALAATRAARTSGLPVDRITPDDFPLPSLAPRLDALIDRIEGGAGCALLRGVPVGGLDAEDLERLFWGLACHVGYPEAQDASGKRLHHVQAELNFPDYAAATRHFERSNTRGYQTNIELAPHVDGSDALFFLCHRKAPSGGLSRLTSAATAFNEILERRPDLAEALQHPYAFDNRGESGARAVQNVPVFTWYRGLMNVLYKRGYIDLAQQRPGVERLTPRRLEAIDLLDSILVAPHNCFEFLMEPGDVLIANNYAVLHSRTQFEDAPDPQHKRHMLRIWATLRRNRRPMPPELRDTREFRASFERRVALGDAT